MNDTLIKMITDSTVVYRKGEEITVSQVGNMDVVEVFGYPPTPDDGVVDVHFVTVGFTEAVPEPEAFAAAVEDSSKGEFTNMTMDELKGGPSYITLGAWLGSQELALRFMALAQHLGLASVITPASVGIEGPEADALAGTGFLFCQWVR